MLKWFQEDESHIYLVEFAISRGYPQQNFSEWAKKHTTFADALRCCKDIQELRLAKILLDPNRKNTVGAIFALKNVARWRDRQEIEQTTEHNINEELKKCMLEISEKGLPPLFTSPSSE